MRLLSVGWALAAAGAAALAALLLARGQDISALEPALRAAGCGFFYGLLAFHLQRVDPDDDHLQAGLVGAVCALRSLGSTPDAAPPAVLLQPPLQLDTLAVRLLSAMMGLIGSWLPLWLPLIVSALLLLGIQRWRPSGA